MTTTPDFRALCKELLDELNYHADEHSVDELITRARAALATPLGPPKNCWLDDEPDLCPSPCVFDDPSEVISNCTYAQTVKCKTDCQYYRAAIPPPEPPTELPSLLTAALKLREENDLSHLFMPPEPPTPCIAFCAPPLEEVIRIDKDGFHYKGQFIADAGEAHRLMMAFLEQNTKTKPEPPTDEELQSLWHELFSHDDTVSSGDVEVITRAALERWGHG